MLNNMCMKGNIYTHKKCFICYGALKYKEQQTKFQCPKHPEQQWTGGCFVRFGKAHTKRFKSVKEAERHLIGLRFKTDEGTFDLRDYQKESPLAFSSFVERYLEHRQKDNISKKQLNHIEHVLGLAVEEWENTNIKLIQEGEIEDFLSKDGISNKTRANYKSVLSYFWKWIVRREKRKSGLEMPEFPKISFELGWRKITDIETQQSILEEVFRISYHINPRIWLGIKLLTLYPKIRPGELRNVQEGHVNLDERWIVFPSPKEKKPKFVHLLLEHADLIRKHWQPRGLPHMYFFRHLSSRSGVIAGAQFGPKQFQKWWNRACKNLGIEGVSLYPGTKHTTVTAAGKKLTPEQIQRGGTGHTSDAFKRYMLPDVNEALVVTKAIEDMQQGAGKVVRLKREKEVYEEDIKLQ